MMAELRKTKDGRTYVRQTIAERFWNKIDIQPSGCWIWTGAKSGVGYAHLGDNGKPILMHRWSYERFHGPIPDGKQINHKCRNRACLNPAHLEAITQKENILLGEGVAATNARKTHCPKGHPFDEANTDRRYVGRQCKACIHQRAEKRWQTIKAKRG